MGKLSAKICVPFGAETMECALDLSLAKFAMRSARAGVIVGGTANVSSRGSCGHREACTEN